MKRKSMVVSLALMLHMQHKQRFLIVALLFMFAQAAAGEVVYLTNSNKFPAEAFSVSVTLEGDEKKISVKLLEHPLNIRPMGFDKFSYNLGTEVVEVSEGDSFWKKNVGQPNADGFGDFQSNKIKAECSGYCHPRVESYGYGILSPLVFTLDQSFDVANLIRNDQGSSLAAHLIFKLNEGNCTFCTWISDGITKCHHTLGHVLNAGADQMIDNGDILTIDLMFKDGFIKGSHSGGGDSGGCSGDDHSDGGCSGGGSGGSDGGCSGDDHSDGGCSGGGSGGSDGGCSGDDHSDGGCSGGGSGGSDGGCSGDDHSDGGCSGGGSGGSGGGSGCLKGIRHGQCEPHNHDVTVDWGDGFIDSIYNAESPLEIDHPYSNSGTYTAKVTVIDEYGREGTDSLQVTVVSINTPTDPILIGTPVEVTAAIPESMLPGGCSDGSYDSNEEGACSSGGHPAIWGWDWGDGSSSNASIEENIIKGSHSYSAPGIYSITLKLTVNRGSVMTEQSARSANYVVVYNPDGGFVTGGGWIHSPEKAYGSSKTQIGKTSFVFDSKYERGAKKPIGNTEFLFETANLKFYSDSYEWLVIAGPGAAFKGTGTINNGGKYFFMLSALDADIISKKDKFIVDRFRIKIWEEIVESNGITIEKVIYDNEPNDKDTLYPETEIQGGSITIHK
jgi:PKD repeat protein